MYNAEILADSLSPTGNRLTTFKVTFPRIVLAEFNTHRMFCLSGDSELTFDLPSGMGESDFKCYKLTLKEFYDKWTNGASPRKRHSYEIHLTPEEIYSAKQIANITGKQVSNIRSRCRDNTIIVQNPDKKRSEDFLIKGSDYNEYHNGYEESGYSLKSRLSSMKIRQINEETGKIQHSYIKDCIYSGVKDVYNLLLENGMSIKCSENHRIYTEDGWKKLKDITDTDYIITQAFGVQEKTNPYTHKKINGKWVNQFIRNIRPEIEREQNGICMNCDNIIEDIHHIEPVHLHPEKAFDKSNLVGLCKQCHLNEHSTQGWQVSQYLYGKPVKVQSIVYVGKEDTYDLEIAGEYPNFLANDIVVHNSRNSASSRAIPFKKMVQMIEENPFIPIAWQKDHKGMQGIEYYSNQYYIDEYNHKWLLARDKAVDIARSMNKPGDEDSGVTKQLCNRLLEPFMWHTVIVTSSEEGLENFFELRCPKYHTPVSGEGFYAKSWKELQSWHSNPENEEKLEKYKNDILFKLQHNKSQADIHIQAIAELMWDAYNESTPRQLKAGEWHIPFGDNFDEKLLDMKHWIDDNTINKVKIATARCARISYETLGDNPKIDYEADIRLHDILLESKHASPFEHIACAMSNDEYYNYSIIRDGKTVPGICANLRGFISYRSRLENEGAL